jgi:hypothetical protein
MLLGQEKKKNPLNLHIMFVIYDIEIAMNKFKIIVIISIAYIA